MTDELEKEITPEQATAIVEGYNALGQTIAEAGIPQAAKPVEEEKPAEETQTDEKPPMESSEDDSTAEEKMVMRPTQAEVNYTTVSTKKGTACANCRWFSSYNPDYGGASGYCHLIDNYPDDILPTGYCDRWEGKPSNEIEQTPIPVVIVEAEKKAIQEHVSVAGRVKDVIKKAIIRPVSTWDDTFAIYKGADGTPYWFARFTNNFEDLQGDVFIEKAHDKYIARVEAGLIPMPRLTLWHLQGTEHGTAQKVMRDGHIVMAVGAFDDGPLTSYCMKYYTQKKGQLELSIGANVPMWARAKDPDISGRLFTDYNAMHITTLPRHLTKAANPYTTFSEDVIMALKPNQKEFLLKDMGIPQEIVDRIERDNETINKKVEELAKYKEFADLVTKSEDKAVDTKQQETVNLFADLIGDHAVVVKIAEEVAKLQKAADVKIEAIEKAHATELKAATDAITALKAEVVAVQKYMELAPRRASADDKTALTPEQQAEVQKQIPTDYDPFFANLGVPKEAK